MYIYGFVCLNEINIVIDDPKNAHLKELEGAKERLILCKADLLDYESLKEAINGCDGVFHTASPVTDDPVSYCFQPFEFFYCLDARNLTKSKNRLDRIGSGLNFGVNTGQKT